MDEVKIDPHEMLKLRDLLDVAGVAYKRSDGYIGNGSFRTYSTDFEVADDRCVAGFSCVLHSFSYGHEAGLLEMWVKGMDDPFGFLTAEEVVERLRSAGLA